MSPIDHLDELVSLQTGEVDRRVYCDEGIFEAEMEQIFGRAWLFLCHETQIPERGDFFAAVMGRDNVLVVRQKDGTIAAFLNSCTHRGNAVCRADEGNARSFLCTYHGWSFGIDGSLKGVPGYRDLYHEAWDKSEYDLPRVAQLDSYRGFVFATHDPDAPSLSEYLGPTGRLGIEQIAARGDMEIIPGIQKFRIKCNWKFPQDNVLDWYHPQVTHASALSSGAIPDPRKSTIEDIDQDELTMQDGQNLSMSKGAAMSGTKMPSVAVLGEFGHAMGGPTVDASAGEYKPEWRREPAAAEILGPIAKDLAGHPAIFPNIFIPGTAQLSLRIPLSPTVTEVWWFSFVDKNASERGRRLAASAATRVFGPAGILEQDDGENWSQATMQTHGFASRDVPVRVNMGVGRGKVERRGGLAMVESLTNEHGQLWLYHCWREWLRGTSWAELRKRTEPPSEI